MANNQAPQATELNSMLNKSEAYIVKYKNQFIAALAALVIIVAGGYAANTWLKNREAKGQTQLSLGMEYFTQGTDDGYTKALNGAGQYQGFLKIAKEYSMTDAANLAHAYAGECYYNLGKYKEAIAQLEDFSPKGDNSVSPAVLGCLANSYAADGQIDRAIDTFKKAASKADNEAFSPLFLKEAATLLESQQKYDEALALYQQIKSDYPTSTLCVPQPQGNGFTAPEIEKYIERATR